MAVTLACPRCGEVFPIPTHVVKVFGHTVLVRMDRSQAHGHMATCPGIAHPPQEASKTMAVPEKLPDAELAGRIDLMLSGGHFMAKGGSGACTMCGITRDKCLSNLGGHPGPAAACCGACGDGNTHPAPMESRGTCAEWGAEHGAKN